MNNYNNEYVFLKDFEKYIKKMSEEEYKKRILQYLINEKSDDFEENKYAYIKNDKNVQEDGAFEVLGYSGVIHALILNFISSNLVDYSDIRNEIINLIRMDNLSDIDHILIFELRYYNKIDQERLIDDLINCYIETKMNNAESSINEELYNILLDHYGSSFDMNEIGQQIENIHKYL